MKVDRSKLEKEIFESICDIGSLDKSQISLDSLFIKDLGFDETDIPIVLFEISEKYNLEIKDSYFIDIGEKNLKPRHFVDYVYRKLG